MGIFITFKNFILFLLFGFSFYLGIKEVLFFFVLLFLPYLNSKLKVEKKHGINNLGVSRLGGIVLIFFSIYTLYVNKLNFLDFYDLTIYFYISCLAVSFVGLIDDLIGGIKAKLKLVLIILPVVLLLYSNNLVLFNNTNIFVFDFFLTNKIISYIITIFIVTGFINATNISDGVNGLIIGISLNLILLFYLITNDNNLIFFIKLLLILLLYNLLAGNVYLGDAGSYFLGFLISTLSLYLYNLNVCSAGFLASCLSYICLEIVYTITRRVLNKQKIYRPDNKHLHNLIFNYFNKKFKFKYNNSLTGITLLIIFSYPSIILFLIIKDGNSYQYWYLFILQLFVYLIIYKFIETNEELK